MLISSTRSEQHKPRPELHNNYIRLKSGSCVHYSTFPLSYYPSRPMKSNHHYTSRKQTTLTVDLNSVTTKQQISISWTTETTAMYSNNNKNMFKGDETVLLAGVNIPESTWSDEKCKDSYQASNKRLCGGAYREMNWTSLIPSDTVNEKLQSGIQNTFTTPSFTGRPWGIKQLRARCWWRTNHPETPGLYTLQQ